MCLVLARQALDKKWSQREASVSRPTIRRKLLSPGERLIEEKHHTMIEKLAEAAEKRNVLEDCYQGIKEAAVIALPKSYRSQFSDEKSASQYFSVAN